MDKKNPLRDAGDIWGLIIEMPSKLHGNRTIILYHAAILPHEAPAAIMLAATRIVTVIRQFLGGPKPPFAARKINLPQIYLAGVVTFLCHGRRRKKKIDERLASIIVEATENCVVHNMGF